jgi:hypothetical protein
VHWVRDQGECPFDLGWWRGTAISDPMQPALIHDPRGLEFEAFDLDNWTTTTGRWLRPSDWDLNGVRDSNDFFDSLADYFEGAADIDLSGTTDPVDFQLFMGDFLG